MDRILVYRIGSIGDTLVALPSFWAIREAFPKAHIAYFTNGENENPDELVAKKVLPEGIFDEWLVYPNDFAKASAGLILNLRKKKFDSLFYLMTRNRGYYRVKRDVLFFRLAGIKKVFGARYLLENLLTMTPAKPVKTVESELEYLLKCLSFENLDLPPINNFQPDLKLTGSEVEKARGWLESNCPEAWREKRLIAVMAGTNWSSKIWAEENYIEIVSRLIKEKNVFPIVFGGKNDREQGRRFLEAWKTGANAAGELGIRGDAGLLRECNLYLGTDTGTMHLAGAVGTPCVAVFAAIDYVGRWTPFGAGHKIFRERVECEGCFAPVCFNHHKCLNLISRQSVYRACLEILENDGSRK
ncbi:MAG TPA: glycosyltransferase family 9 protein [Pyrinomonadaceae bacterium]|nr:glycosyltransferase family 9 protein [Pyrinomonadaceae bacterium]